MTDVSELVAMFEESEQATMEARKLAERDRDYYDNKQWTAAEEAKIKKRGQPVTTHNAIQRKVDYMSGLERQTRRDPKAFPRTPDDEQAAQASTDAIRYACDNANWDDARSAAWDNLIIEGQCAIMVGARNAKGGVDPDITHIRWDRFFADPHAARMDFADANYMGFLTWDDADNAKELFTGKDEVIDQALSDQANSETYGDTPKWKLWADSKRRRIRYAEMYYRKSGTWYRCIFTRSGHLTGPEPSPYLDEDGKPENPIKAVCLRRDRDNNTYGDVRIMISPQDGLNKGISKALHIFTMRQARIGRGAGVDGDSLKRELAKPDGVITADKDEFEVLPTNDMGAAALNMMGISRGFIDGLGANASLQGKQDADLSGKALIAQQQGGMIELARAMDRLRVLSLSVYRSVWARIRQFWTGPRWIRITDDQRNLRFVGLNQPVTMLQAAQEHLAPMLQDPAQAEQAKLQLAMLAQDPMAQQPIKIDNQITELDVDIILDEGIDSPTTQSEQFDLLAKIIPTAVNLPPAWLEALIMASQLRDKDKILEKLGTQQGPQVPPELMQQIQQGMQLIEELGQKVQQLEGQLADKSAEHQLKGAEIGLKGREVEQADQQIEIDAYRAETERREAMKPEPRPSA